MLETGRFQVRDRSETGLQIFWSPGGPNGKLVVFELCQHAHFAVKHQASQLETLLNGLLQR